MNPNDLLFDNIRIMDGLEENKKFQELVESIKVVGVTVPITYWINEDGQRVIDSGHKRCMAAQIAGLKHVPVTKIDRPSETERIQRQVLQNTLREDLDHMSLAFAYGQWMLSGASQKEVAEATGKSPTYISQHLSLPSLPEKIQTEIRLGNLSYRAGYKMTVDLDDDDIVANIDALIAARTVNGVGRQCRSILAAKMVATQMEADFTEPEQEEEEQDEKDDVTISIKNYFSLARQYIQGAITLAKEAGTDIAAYVKEIKDVLDNGN